MRKPLYEKTNSKAHLNLQGRVSKPTRRAIFLLVRQDLASSYCSLAQSKHQSNEDDQEYLDMTGLQGACIPTNLVHNLRTFTISHTANKHLDVVTTLPIHREENLNSLI